MKVERAHPQTGIERKEEAQSVMMGSEGPREGAYTLTCTCTHTHTAKISSLHISPELLQAARCLRQRPLKMQRSGCSHAVIMRSFIFLVNGQEHESYVKTVPCVMPTVQPLQR